MLSFLNFPQHIQLQTHSKCNMACSMCPHPDLKRNRDKGVLEWEAFRRIIDEAVSHQQFGSIVLDLQNEPTLDAELIKRIEYIRQVETHPIFIGMTSNGLKFDDELAKKLFSAGLSKVVFSLNATTSSSYNKISPRVKFESVKGNLDKVLNVPELRDKVVVSFGISADNTDEATNFIAEMESRSAKYRVFPYGTRLGDARSDIISKQSKALFKSCHYPLYAMPIRLTGDVLLCCHDWLGREDLGNVLESSISAVWNSKNYIKIRKNAATPGKLPTEMCSSCDSPYEYNGHISMNDSVVSRLGSYKNIENSTRNIAPKKGVKNSSSLLSMENSFDANRLDKIQQFNVSVFNSLFECPVTIIGFRSVDSVMSIESPEVYTPDSNGDVFIRFSFPGDIANYVYKVEFTESNGASTLKIQEESILDIISEGNFG